jgi:FkbM family methyltransferase
MKFSRIPLYIKSISTLSLCDFLKLIVNLPRYYFHIASGTRYLERKVNDYRMLLDLNDKGISKELTLLASREKEHSLILKNELKSGMAALDIGANIGYYSVMMGKIVGGNGKVYAVEPSVSNYHMLNLNLHLNNMEKVVEAFNLGISSRTGTGKFYLSEKSNWHTFYPKVHSNDLTESLKDTTPVDVPVITVKDFSAGKRKIDLIRMDIEGYEVEVLDSIAPMLQNNEFSPKILFEVHRSRYDDKEHNMKPVLKKIFAAGYHTKILASLDYNKKIADLFQKYGYYPKQIIKTDYLRRAIFENISDENAIELMCYTDYVRSVLLVKKQ